MVYADYFGIDKEEIGQRVKDLRLMRGMCVNELAEFFNHSPQAIYRWESGECLPSLENIGALARFFSVTLDWLVFGEGESRNVA